MEAHAFLLTSRFQLQRHPPALVFSSNVLRSSGCCEASGGRAAPHAVPHGRRQGLLLCLADLQCVCVRVCVCFLFLGNVPSCPLSAPFAHALSPSPPRLLRRVGCRSLHSVVVKAAALGRATKTQSTGALGPPELVKGLGCDPQPTCHLAEFAHFPLLFVLCVCVCVWCKHASVFFPASWLHALLHCSPVEVAALGGKGVVAVAAGAVTSYATTNGTAYAWGFGENNQLTAPTDDVRACVRVYNWGGGAKQGGIVLLLVV